MYFDDIDIGSLHIQKVPYPLIESVVLNDQDGISVEMRYCFYAPVDAEGKDIFDSYKHLLSTNVALYTYDASEDITDALEAGVQYLGHWGSSVGLGGIISDEGPFVKMNKDGVKYFLPKRGEDSQHASPHQMFTQSTLYEYGGQQYRKFTYTVEFKNLKAMEYNAPSKLIHYEGKDEEEPEYQLNPNTDKYEKIKKKPVPNSFIADDRVVDLMGFIQVSANLANGALPFAAQASAIAYAFPFVIAKGGIVDFKYQILQTNDGKMWTGPYADVGQLSPISYATANENPAAPPESGLTSLVANHTHDYTIDEFGNGLADSGLMPIYNPHSDDTEWAQHTHEIKNYILETMDGHTHELPTTEILTKLPVPENDPGLTSAVVSDPAALSNFVGFGKGDIFDLGENQDIVSNLLTANKIADMSFKDYFDSHKLEAMESPFSQIFFWDDTAPTTMNLAFMFDMGKFMKTALSFNNGSNAYGLNIKSMSLLRKKVAKNISEKFTKDFLEETIWSSWMTAGLKGLFSGQVIPQGTDKIVLRGYDCSTAEIQKTIFVVKDKTVNKKYKYEYRVKITFDSKFGFDLSSSLVTVSKYLNKFAGLENVIMLSKFYDADFGRMTPKFVKEFGEILTQLRQSFNTLFVRLVGFLGEDYVVNGKFDLAKLKNKEAFFSAQQVASAVGKLLSVDPDAGTTVLTPGTFFIIKDLIQESLNQVKTFDIMPNVTQKIKGDSSEAPAISTNYYKLPSGPLADGSTNYSVGFDQPAHFFLDYFSKETPVKSSESFAITLDKGQYETLQKLEIAKYLGNTGSYGKINLRERITPLALTAGNASIQTLNDDNIFILNESHLTDFVLSMQKGEAKSYKAPTQDTQVSAVISPLLDSLLKDGVSIIDSTREEAFTSPSDLSKLSFLDFFGGSGNPFNPKNEPEQDVSNYQDLQKLTTIYNFINQVGAQKFADYFGDEGGLLRWMATPSSWSGWADVDVPLYALGNEPTSFEASADLKSLYLQLDQGKKLSDGNSILSVLLFTNTVEMYVFMSNANSNKGSSWQPYKEVKNNLTSPNVLARWQLTSGFPLNQRIVDQYFIFTTKNVSGKITFKIPNIKAPDTPPVEFDVDKAAMNVFSKAMLPAMKDVVSMGLKQSLFEIPSKSVSPFPSGPVTGLSSAGVSLAAQSVSKGETAMKTMSVSVGVLSNLFGNVASSKTTGKSSKSGKSIEGAVGKMEVKQTGAQGADGAQQVGKQGAKSIKGKMPLNIPMNFGKGKY